MTLMIVFRLNARGTKVGESNEVGQNLANDVSWGYSQMTGDGEVKW